MFLLLVLTIQLIYEAGMIVAAFPLAQLLCSPMIG